MLLAWQRFFDVHERFLLLIHIILVIGHPNVILNVISLANSGISAVTLRYSTLRLSQPSSNAQK